MFSIAKKINPISGCKHLPVAAENIKDSLLLKN